ncbi:hypothetical protein [Rhodococcus sp. B10]|uniref:hypothetical protein n=1 Tax=Rhodococcus sp. B10 TaxID=2695876 RepID=UPI0014300D99|nr:hypothetical protein [Rhodococcus sp. B10]NIL77621.1 hypothetical protein [Rhodococcus sp. B10]
MSRTPEQIAADDAIEAAIEQARVAYGEDDPDSGKIITAWYLVSKASYFDGDDDLVAWSFFKRSSMDIGDSQGILNVASIREDGIASAVLFGED